MHVFLCMSCSSYALVCVCVNCVGAVETNVNLGNIRHYKMEIVMVLILYLRKRPLVSHVCLKQGFRKLGSRPKPRPRER